MSNRPGPVRPPSAALLAGVARRDITPPIGIYARNWGAARHDVAEGIHRPLTATVLAMRSGADAPPLILASIDATWWQGRHEEWQTRGAVLVELGLPPEAVMISCSHTHAGPSLSTDHADKPGGALIAPYLDTLRTAVIDAAREALNRLAPAVMTWATGRCDLATNRDLPDPDADRIVCGHNPTAPADDTLLVGRVTTADGAILATLVNYACHPTTLAWENRLISPDFVGAMREVVEAGTGGAPCLFLQGASGELAPREQYTGDVAVADANGRRLGYAALATLAGMLPPAIGLGYRGVVESGAPLATWDREPFEPPTQMQAVRLEVPLPLRPLPTIEEVRRDLAACTDRVQAERLRRRIRVIESVGPGPESPQPVWIWRVGQAVFVGHPNEAYSALQIRLRQRFAALAVVVMNVVNGHSGYLAPPELYDRDVYQVWQSPFDRDSLPRLIRACEDQIERLLAETV